MRFDADHYHRGMHSLTSEPDHQVLARARFKGLFIHPAVVEPSAPATTRATPSHRGLGKRFCKKSSVS